MIKVGIIGAGAIANNHIEAYLAFKDRCRIVALADIYPEKAREKSENFDLQAAVYGDYQEMLESESFDLVSICVPPFGHASAAIDALNAGRHVLLEKPMATSLDECDRMLEAAKENERLLSIVAQNRFTTAMLKLKRILDSGVLGEIVHGQVDSFWWRGDSYYDLWWRGTWEKEGGGCTMNHAVHHIDLFQWMMGMPEEVLAVTTNLAHRNSEVEDFSTTVLRYADGRLGQVTASLVHHGEEQQIVFQGERGMVKIPWKVRASVPMENGFPESNPELEAEINAQYENLPPVKYTGHTGQIDNVLGAIEGEQVLLIDGREGRKTLELVMAIYQSGATGLKVTLPLTSADPFYTHAGILENAPHYYEKTRSVENFATDTITLGRDYDQEGEG